jgi:hypothetical protein
MTTPSGPPRLDAAALHALAKAAPQQGCSTCEGLASPGWETLPSGFDERLLRTVATLRGDDPEPTLQEYHPAGTRLWSPDAPIAPAYFPYNRCDVAACPGCGRLFLRYTEFGGYYVDQRVRELRAGLVVDAS